MKSPELVLPEGILTLTFFRRTVRTPLLLAFLGAFSVWADTLTNVLINNPGGDATPRNTQSRSALVLGSGPVILSAFTDSGSFDGLPGGDNDQLTGYGRSTDGGLTWTDLGKLPLGLPPIAGDGGNPALAHSKQAGIGGLVPDTIYLATETFGPVKTRIQMFRSQDNGLTFLAPVNATPGGFTGPLTDPSIAADNFPGAGQGTVYLVFRSGNGGATFLTSSTDGGASWTLAPTVTSEGATQRPWVTVGPDHEVYIFYYTEVSGNRIRMRKSSEAFGVIHEVSGPLNNSASANGELGLYGSFRSRIAAQAVVSPINPNLVFAVYSDAAAASADKSDVILRYSTDGGTTWPAAHQRRINDDATLNDQFAPALAIAPDGASLFVGWYDRRLDPGNYLIDTFGAIGTLNNSLVPPTFSPGPNFRISSQSFPPVVDVDAAVDPTFMGDHDTAQADENFFYYSWGDNRPGASAQPDVRFARIPLLGPGGQLALAGVGVVGGEGSNHNGLVERNECNTLFITLVNSGTAPVGGISATLSSPTVGVTVDQANSAYLNMNAGTSDTNMTPFNISTSPAFVCGTTIHLLLTVATTNAGTFTIPLKLPTGSLNVTTAEIPIVAKTIADNSTTTFLMTVTGVQGAIGKLTTALHILHPQLGELSLTLEAPDGSKIVLSSENGSGGNSYGLDCSNRAIFDDNGGISVTVGAIPFLGPIRPEQALAAFNGKSGADVNGIWKLHVQDDALGNVGTLECWSLSFSSFNPEAVFTAAPNAPVGMGILDNSTIEVPLEVSGITEALGKISVSINHLAHAAPEDLDISLVGPDGTTVLLTSDNGETDDAFGGTTFYVGTIFEDSAVHFITAGTVPFTGKFRPEQPLAAFIGKSGSAVNGTWKLRLRDDTANSTGGTLFSWSLGLSTPGCFAGGAPCVRLASAQVVGGNGNGRLDPNECAGLNIEVRNDTAAALTGVTSSLTLFSLTPGVAVIQGNSAYSDIGPGLTGTNLTPFRISVGANVLCGTVVQLLLSVNSAEGRHFEVLVQLQLGACGPMTFVSQPGPTPIPDAPGVLRSQITIPDNTITSSIVKVAVSMRITHPFDESLKVTLTSPGISSPITVLLTSNNGGTEPNYGTVNTPTTFDDMALLSITSGSAPFTGTFLPEESLFKFVGLPAGSANGTWTLSVEDTVLTTSGGMLESWSLSICQGESFGTIAPSAITEAALNNANDVPLLVSGVGGGIGKVSVSVFLAHGNIEDVDLYLISPDNSIVPLSSNNGGAVASSYGSSCLAPAVFDDDAQHPIQGAPAPFTGAYRPESPLAALTGKSSNAVNGIWHLRVVDSRPNLKVGVLQCWGLNITPLTCANGAGVCPELLRTLTVASLMPASNVMISINPLLDGITPFSRQCDLGTIIPLTAPPFAPGGNSFDRWIVDGVDVLTPNITVTMDVPHTVVAQYKNPVPPPPLTHSLSVLSMNPTGMVQILIVPSDQNGNDNGLASFARTYLAGSLVMITAVAPGGKVFDKWDVDNGSIVDTNATLTLLMDRDHQVSANFKNGSPPPPPPPVTHSLSVLSMNSTTPVQILVVPSDQNGNDDGLTSFSRTYLNGSSVMLTAVVPSGKVFDKWDVDNGSNSDNHVTMTILMDRDHQLNALFRDAPPPPGNAFALRFDGVDDYVGLLSSDSLSINGRITVEAWINRDEKGVQHSIVEKFGCRGDAARIGGYALRVTANDKLMFQTKSDCNVRTSALGATSLNAGTWYHVAGVWDGANLKVYVNGVLDGSVASGAAPQDGDTPLIIGARGNNPALSPFKGMIDEVRLWQNSRTDAEILDNINACLIGDEANLVGYWRCNEGSGLVLHDTTANGNNGLLTNGPQWVNSPGQCDLPSPSPLSDSLPALAGNGGGIHMDINESPGSQSSLISVQGTTPGTMPMVEMSKDLVHWVPLICVTNNTTGSFRVTDHVNRKTLHRFFRVRVNP